MELLDGAVITLACQSAIPGPAFLDGTTADGTVGLAPRTDGVYTGTHWQVTNADEGCVTLACAGTTQGPRYLEARGADHSVGLVPDTEPPYTGTRWWVRNAGADLVMLQSVDGEVLTGLTDPAIRSVTLSAPETDPAPSGTRWRVTVLAHPTLTIRATRTATGATLELRGEGFTSHDLIRFNNPRVAVRAVDRHGLTATSVTDVFRDVP